MILTCVMDPNKRRILAIVLIFVFLEQSLTIPSTDGKHNRVRRQACEEGTSDGRTCCKCGAGYKRMELCTALKNDTQCEPCEDNTFNPVPNLLTSCEPCKSCSQPTANLEEATSCSHTRDTVCKCKENHYCISGTHPCTECSPCKVCDPDVGVKVECSPTNNTICNETNKSSGKNVGIGVAVSVVVLAIVAFGAVFWWWKKRKGSINLNSAHQRNGVMPSEIEMEPLNASTVNVSLTPHIPEIASEIGWLDMKNIAISTNMKMGTITAAQQNHPQDCLEQTIQLLTAWEEMVGSGASRKLVECLINSGKRRTAERVTEILRKSTSSHPPV